MTSSLDEFRDPPQGSVAYCAECGAEMTDTSWRPLDETECTKCETVGRWTFKLRYEEKHPLKPK